MLEFRQFRLQISQSLLQHLSTPRVRGLVEFLEDPGTRK